MFDKYGTKLEEGNRVIVSAEDVEQCPYFGKFNILEIKFDEYLKKHLALVDYGSGDWVESDQIIYLQEA